MELKNALNQARIGGSTVIAVHTAELIANAATSLNTASAVVRRGASGEFSAGAITATSLAGPLTGNVTGNTSGSASSFTGSLLGDVTGTQGSTTVVQVGGSSASNIHAAELLANAATSSKTNNAIARRDGSGAIAADVTGNLTGNVTGNTSGSAGSFTGSLAGDVTGGQGSTVVALVGGSAAALVHTAELAVNSAASANTVGKLVLRDGSGNFSAGIITATSHVGPLTGNVTGNVSGSSASFTGSLVGDVTGTQGATVVSMVGGSTSALVHAAELLANAATSVNTANALVRRDGTGKIAVGGVVFPDATVQTTAPAALTLTAVGSTPNANAASVVSGALNLQPADASNPGVLTTGAQTIAGAKTFSSAIIANLTGNASGSAASFTGSLVGDVTGTQGSTVVASVGGSTAASVHTSQLATAAATSAATPSTLVLRDGSNNAALNVTGSVIQVGGVTATALAAPVNATFTLGAGTLTTGTKYYRVTALWNDGETLASTETSLAITGPAGVNVNWSAVAGATGYRVYGRSTGAETLLATLGLVTTWLDDGSLTPSGALPTFNSTGGLSMPGNQTYTGTGGVLFNTPNVSNAVSGSLAVVSCFVYRGPVGWTGANAAGRILDVQDGNKNSLFNVDRFGNANIPNNGSGAGFVGAQYANFAGNLTTIAGTSNDGFRQTAVAVNSSNLLIDPSAKLLVFRNAYADRSFISPTGAFNGGVDATSLAVRQIPTPVATDGSISAILGTGSLAAGTYYYRVSALNALGETLASTERAYVLASTGSVRIVWTNAVGATSYNIYGRTTGAEKLMANVDAQTQSLFVNLNAPQTYGVALSWTDDGSITPSGALPTANTTAGISGGFTVKPLPPPTLRAFTTGAGTLTAATYYYRVSALNDFGETLACAEKSYVLGSTGGINVNWNAVPGASQFKVYGRTTGAEQLIATVGGQTFTFLDSGSITPSGALPTVNQTGNISTAGKLIDTGATNASGSPGAATQNSATGKSAIAAGASSVTITNAFCTASSLVAAWIQQAAFDATLTTIVANPGAGSFTITGNAAATAAVTIAWEILNN